MRTTKSSLKILATISLVLLIGLPFNSLLAAPSQNNTTGVYADTFDDATGLSTNQGTVDTTNKNVKLALTSADTFTETFSATTYKDANTTATWDTSVGKTNLPNDLSFANAVNYAISSFHVAITSADFDGDNYIDLVTTRGPPIGNQISILLNNGNGTFASAVGYTVGSKPRDVTSADFDGDGDKDLATANEGSDNVSILFNNGNGVFGNATTTAVGDSPQGITSADFNSDTYIDLAVANYNDDNVSILFNDGSGVFGNATTTAAGDAPCYLTSADLDGVNGIDLAVINYNSNNVSILLNNGDGTFASAINYSVGSSPPRGIISADLDGVNGIDLAVSNNYNSGDNVFILLNNGNGTFASAVGYYVVNGYPVRLTSADLENDNDIDLAVPKSTGNEVSILRNNGDGTFAFDDSYSVGTYPYQITSADFDGDNYIDLATVNMQSSNVSVLINNFDIAVSKVALSTNLNPGRTVLNATLTATRTLNGGTITYQMSADGGSHWEDVTSGTEHTFTNQGDDLRWKATLSTANINTNVPEIDTIAISYQYYPTSTNKNVISSTITPSEVGDYDRAIISQTLNNQSIKYYVLDSDGNLIPDSELTGNSSGFSASGSSTSIDLSSITASSYSALKIKAVVSTSSSTSTPTIDDWNLYWIKAKGVVKGNTVRADSYAGDEVSFNASLAVGESLTYLWDFDSSDGVDWNNPDATGVTASHTYTQSGNYTATLRVKQGTGTAIDQKTFSILVLEKGVAYYEPSSPNKIVLTVQPGSLVADGQSTSNPSAEVWDQYGSHIADGTKVNWSIVSGSGTLLNSQSTTLNGFASNTFKAPKITSEPIENVKIKVCTSNNKCDQKTITLSFYQEEKPIVVKEVERIPAPEVKISPIFDGGLRAISQEEIKLVKTKDSSAVYLVKNNKKQLIPHSSVFQSWGYDFKKVETIQSSQLQIYQDAGSLALRDGVLVRSNQPDKPAVYVVENSKLRPIQSAQVFENLKYGWKRINWLSEALVESYEKGEMIGTAVSHPAGTLIKYPDFSSVYLIENGKARPIKSAQVFKSLGFDWKNILVLPKTFQYQTGEVIE